MNERQASVIHRQAQEKWKEMERFRLAYLAQSESSGKRATMLNICTLIATVTLASFSAAPAANLAPVDPQRLAYLAAIAAVLSGLDKLLKLEKKSSDSWKCCSNLAGLQRTLFHRVLSYSTSEVQDESMFLDNLIGNIKEATQYQVHNLSRFEDRMEQEFDKHGISGPVLFNTLDENQIIRPVNVDDSVVGVRPMLRTVTGGED